jgi:glycosyltransferase involved in cell wall biosynthesis
MRADAARYLLLDHFGGVYADLDTECLQELEPLLAGEDLLLPLEPEAHVSSMVAAESKIRRIVGNAWMASKPGHPFWKRVLEEMIRRRHLPGPLETTGPFLLSDVVNRMDLGETPRLLASDTVFPATNLDMEWLDARLPGSRHWFGPSTYAIHYWHGSWWRKKKNLVKTYVLSGAESVLSGWMDETKAATNRVDAAFTPLVSCLMVTGRRPHLAALAIEAFRRQTYPHKELVIIDDSGSDAVGEILADGDDAIRWIRVPQENKPLGALRNLALAEAKGDLLCQWDDDDLSAPARIERQVRALKAAGAEACGLVRLQLWWPARDWIATSSSRVWECALLWRRGAISAYPEIRSGEDTPPVKSLVASGRVAMIDSPGLYTYTYHGQNTFPDAHWQSLWLAAGSRATGTACRLKLQFMQSLLPCDEYLRALGLPGFTEAQGSAPAAPAPAESTAGSRPFTLRSSKTDLPQILIATPVKDAVPFLEGFFANLVATDYPAKKLSIAFLESDSGDATAAHAEQLLSSHRERFASTQLLRKDFGLRLPGVRWESSVQEARRSVLAKSRNQLIEGALGNEDWVLWIDVDVVSWPPDILYRLVNDRGAIVTPHCVRAPRGPSYDLNSFVIKKRPTQDAVTDENWLEGGYRPPLDGTRLYLDSFRDQEEVILDSVGGTMLLVPGDLHRDGLRFPARPYRGHLETEGLAMMAKEFGVECRGLPQVEIIHA